MSKKKKPATKTKTASEPVVCPFVKFTQQMVHRSKLLGAEYNPRTIQDEARKELMDNIKRVGLVDGPVWNIRTGRVVSGHQRLSILDTLMKTQDYMVPVSVVDLDEKTEREQNIFLNNEHATGDWDIAKLGEMFKSKEIAAENTGFPTASLYMLFGDNPMTDQPEQLDALAAQMREARERYNLIKGAIQKRDDPDFYQVVFASVVDRLAWLDLIDVRIKDNRFVEGPVLVMRYQAMRDEIAELKKRLAEYEKPAKDKKTSV